MPIINQKEWNNWVNNNTNSYSSFGRTCVDVTRRSMEILDQDDDFDCHQIIHQALGDINVGGITGFMASWVALMISRCHSRGEEFRQKWNLSNQINDEGNKANESGGVLNAPFLTIEAKK